MSPVVDACLGQSGLARLQGGLDALRRRRLAGNRLTYRERLGAFQALSDALLARGPDVLRTVPTGLAFLASFLRSTNLQCLVARELAQVEALDRFVPIGERKSLRLMPRGVACHWIAGNVPLLGLFSWAVSALVGNANVLRVSSRSTNSISPILDLLQEVSDAGHELAADTLVVQFPREDDDSHRAMSAGADVRIAWGGREAVESVMALPTRWDCETVVMGPRMSLAVVDPSLATNRVLSRLASDIAYFDQQACSSPQWVFVKGRLGSAAFERCVHDFTSAFADHAAGLGRHTLDTSETYQIELDRARILLNGGVLHRDRQTAWTVAVLDAPNTRVACANRFVQMIPFADVVDICPMIPNNVQTAVTLLNPHDTERFSETAAIRGVCRFPRPGEANLFENPWDGVPLLSHLTRWVIRTEAAH